MARDTQPASNRDEDQAEPTRDIQIGQLLRRAYVHAKKHSSAVLLEIGNITPVQASAILALAREPRSQADLGRWIDMEKANVHGLVRRLESAEIVSVESDPEHGGRSYVALTSEGHRLAALIAEGSQRSSEATLQRLDADERSALLRLLEKLLS
jgi:DNA-binding MarR family transcriptional regulator